jgi:hypothetical protein
MRHRIPLAFTLLVVFAVSTFLPPNAHAIVFDEYVVYYADCEGSVVNGWKWTECDRTVTHSGTFSGHWKMVDWYYCSDGRTGIEWYEWCNGHWVFTAVGYQTPPCNCP